jgi:PAS domain-containing protein
MPEATPSASTDVLARTSALLQATLDALADGVIVVSAGRIVAHNRRFAELWRIPEAVLAAGDNDAAVRHVLPQLADPDDFFARVAAVVADPLLVVHDTILLADAPSSGARCRTSSPTSRWAASSRSAT